jgi:hypothetical protein
MRSMTIMQTRKWLVMVSRFNMILQGIRDVALIVVCVLTLSTSYGMLALERYAYFVFGIVTTFLILSAINMILLLKKVKEKMYFYFNAIVQLFPSFMLTLYSVWIGPVFLVLNIAIIVTLIERKKKQKAKQRIVQQNKTV